MPTSSSSPDLETSLGQEVCAALRRQVGKLGLDIGDEPVWAEASFVAQADPYTGEHSQLGTWRGKARYGTVTLFPDGRVFAEYQVLQPLPGQAGQYVEAVQVWGRPGALKGDAVIATFAA